MAAYANAMYTTNYLPQHSIYKVLMSCLRITINQTALLQGHHLGQATIDLPSVS